MRMEECTNIEARLAAFNALEEAQVSADLAGLVHNCIVEDRNIVPFSRLFAAAIRFVKARNLLEINESSFRKGKEDSHRWTYFIACLDRYIIAELAVLCNVIIGNRPTPAIGARPRLRNLLSCNQADAEF